MVELPIFYLLLHNFDNRILIRWALTGKVRVTPLHLAIIDGKEDVVFALLIGLTNTQLAEAIGVKIDLLQKVLYQPYQDRS